MQRVRIPGAGARLSSRVDERIGGTRRALAKRENLTSRRSLNFALSQRNEGTISSALEGRLCEIAAPIQRGIEPIVPIVRIYKRLWVS